MEKKFFGEVSIYKNVGWKEVKIDKKFDNIEDYEKFISSMNNSMLEEKISRKANDIFEQFGNKAIGFQWKIEDSFKNLINSFVEEVKGIKNDIEVKEEKEKIKDIVEDKFNGVVNFFKEKINKKENEENEEEENNNINDLRTENSPHDEINPDKIVKKHESIIEQVKNERNNKINKLEEAKNILWEKTVEVINDDTIDNEIKNKILNDIQKDIEKIDEEIERLKNS